MTEKEDHEYASHWNFPYYFADAGAEDGPDWISGVEGIHFGDRAYQPSKFDYDLAIYYNTLQGDDYLDCRCSRWDVDNYSIVIETWLKEGDVKTLQNNTVPGAVGELYTILGKPLYFDKTWDGSNTLRLMPTPSSTHMNTSTLRKMRRETLIYPKNITSMPIKGPKDWVLVKIEGYASGSTF